MSGFYSELPGEALLHIAGPDTLQFLQGQTTCDTRKLTAEQALPGAYCTPQGRVIADFLLLSLAPEHVVLRLRRDILDTTAAAFGKYIPFSRAELDASREDWQLIACWGEGAGTALAGLAGALPDKRYGAASTEGCAIVQLDDAGRQFEVYADRERMVGVLAQLEKALQAADESAWRAAQARAGIARVEAPTSGEYTPQVLNYDLTGHVSFNKGCYTGQEIVARLHYRGKVKQRTYLAQIDTPVDLPAGTRLFTPGLDSSTGTLLNSAIESGHTVCLVAATSQGVSGGLLAGGEDGPGLTTLPLPYALPGED